MGLSVFNTLVKRELTNYLSGNDILGVALDFSKNTQTNNFLGTPINTMREVQIQFTTSGPAGDLEVTFDNSANFVVLNNSVSVDGLATFTIFVDTSTFLNFRLIANAALLTIWVGG